MGDAKPWQSDLSVERRAVDAVWRLCDRAVTGLVLIACRVIDRRQPIPYGPFLALCGYWVYLYGSRILELWL